MNAQQKMIAARETLVIDQRFFGALLWNMPLIEATQVRGNTIDTMATDGTSIWFNPTFVDGLVQREVVGVLMHEVLHRANLHHLRRNGRDPVLWNDACDYAVNPIVIQNGYPIAEGMLFNAEWAKLSAEEIYFKLTPPPPPPQSVVEQPEPGDRDTQAERTEAATDDSDDDGGEEDAQSQDGASIGEDEGTSDEAEAAEGTDEGEGAGEGTADHEGSVPGAGNGSKAGLILDPLTEDGTALSPAEIEDEKQAIEIEIVQAEHAAQRAGQMPGGLDRVIEEIKNPTTDWRDVLREFVTKSVTTPTDHTWARTNRRMLHTHGYLPGWKLEDTGPLLVGIDTSGSIDVHMLGTFISELRRIIEDTNPESVTVMACDSEVRWQWTFEPGEDLMVKAIGGGGTKFAPLFAEADATGIPFAACVYFTDLDCRHFGPAPAYPVLWAHWENHDTYTTPAQLRERIPFGTAIPLKVA